MQTRILYGILIPFLGTALGSACVLFMKNNLNAMLQRALMGFAAGVMTAASVSVKLCGGSNDICCGRGAYSRDVRGYSFQSRNSAFRCGLYRYDGA